MRKEGSLAGQIFYHSCACAIKIIYTIHFHHANVTIKLQSKLSSETDVSDIVAMAPSLSLWSGHYRGRDQVLKIEWQTPGEVLIVLYHESEDSPPSLVARFICPHLPDNNQPQAYIVPPLTQKRNNFDAHIQQIDCRYQECREKWIIVVSEFIVHVFFL